MAAGARRRGGPLLFALLFLPKALACGEPDGCDVEDSSLLALQPRKGAERAPLQAGCGARQGVFWNLGGRWHERRSFEGWTPLEVPERGWLQLFLCGVGNRKVASSETVDSRPPTLVSSVGARARVKVRVEDSFNVDLTGSLTIGNEASLVPVAIGAVEAGTVVNVTLRGSGNVRGGEELEVSLGALLHFAVVSQLFSGVDAHVDVSRCGNAEGVRRVRMVRDGNLMLSQLRVKDVENSTVLVAVEESASVTKAEIVEVSDGFLAREAVSVSQVSGSSLTLRLEETGGCGSESLAVKARGSLVAGALFAARMTNAKVSIDVEKVAVASVGDANLTEGYLLREVLHCGRGEGLVAKIDVGGSASVKAKKLTVSAFDWQQEITAALLNYAMSGYTCNDCRLKAGLKSAATAQASEVTLEGRAASLLYKAVSVENEVQDTSAGTKLEVEFDGVGTVSARSVKVWQDARFARGFVMVEEALGLEAKVTVEESFNAVASKDFSVFSAGYDLIGDMLKTAPCTGCTLSVSSVESVNIEVGGEMLLGLSGGGLISDVYDGALVNSTTSVEMRRSANLKVRGNLNMTGLSNLIGDVTDGSLENSSLSLLMEESAKVEVEKDLYMGYNAALIADVIDAPFLKNSKLAVELRDSCNAKAGGAAFFLFQTELISDLLDIYDEGLQSSTVDLKLHEVALVNAKALEMYESSSLIRHVMDLSNVETSNITASGKSVCKVDVEKAKMNTSTLSYKVHDVISVSQSSFKEHWEDFAKVHTQRLSLHSGYLMKTFLDVTALSILESAVEATLQDGASVKAQSVAMNASAAFGTGVFVRGNSTSGMGLAFESVGNVIGEEKAVLRHSSLLGPVFELSSQADGLLSASLQSSASVETRTSAGLLVEGSLLSTILVVGAGATLETMQLDIKDTGVVCPQDYPGAEGEVVAKNISFCEDGRRTLQREADSFRRSCMARHCRLEAKTA